LSDTELALRQLNDLKDYLDRCNELKGRDKGGNQPQNRKSRASGPRTRITRDELLAAVGDLGGHADAFASFVDDLRPLGVYPDRTTEGVALRFPDPAGSRQQFRIARVRRTGRVRIGLLRSQLEGRGYSTEPVFKQVRTIVGWLPGALVDESGALIGPDGLRNDVSVGLLMKDWREQYGNAVRELLDDIRKAAADATARPIAVNARAVPESGHGAD
jgi:hypothetical protein